MNRLLLCWALLATSAYALPARFEVSELGSLGSDRIAPTAINNRGEITGNADDSHARPRVFRSRPGRRVEPSDQLPVPEGKDYLVAWNIGEDGTVVGFSRDSGGWTTPYLWPPTGGVVQAGEAGELWGANSTGDVVGSIAFSRDGRAMQVPFLRRRDGTTASYNAAGGQSKALAINDFGVIVGEYRISPSAAERAFKWTGSNSLVELGPLPVTYSHATSITSTGHWLAYGSDGRDTPHRTFVGSPDGAFVELMAPTGAYSPMGTRMNNVGWVVGSVQKNGRFMAAVWHAGSTPIEAMEVLPRLSRPLRGELRGINGVNDDGVMVGDVANGPAVVLTPVRLSFGIDSDVFAGRAHVVTVRDCEPGSKVKLFRGTRRAANPLIDRSLGIRYDLQDGALLGGEVVANSAGVATFSVVLSTTPGAVLLQAAHRGNKSPVIEVKVKKLALMQAPAELKPQPKLPTNRKVPPR